MAKVFVCLPLAIAALTHIAFAQRVFDVRDYGATGRKSDDARPALQKAIDACGKAGGGRVYVPPGEYTSGQLHLRSGVRLYLEAGATIYATLDSSQYDDARKGRADLMAKTCTTSRSKAQARSTARQVTSGI